jgi:hypothetical protein
MSDLLEVLEINPEKLPKRCTRAVNVVRGQRVERGQPVYGTVLAEFLDQAIDFCKQMELVYPKVLLLRLKQLQRGEWRPAPGAVN